MGPASPIASAQNPLLKRIRRALERGELTEDGLCVLEGRHLAEEARRSPVEIERTLEEGRDVSPEALRRIATTETSPGVLTLVRLRRWLSGDLTRHPALCVVLDGVQDPGNAGTIARSAEAFGATGLLFRPGSVSPYHSKVMRAAAGSLLRLPFVQGGELPAVTLYAADAHRGEDIRRVDFRQPCAIVVGSEARGISAEVAAVAVPIRIPTRKVESLNAAMAATLILWEAWRVREPV